MSNPCQDCLDHDYYYEPHRRCYQKNAFRDTVAPVIPGTAEILYLGD